MKYWLHNNENIFRQTDLQEVRNTATVDVFPDDFEVESFPSVDWTPFEIFTLIALLKLKTKTFNKIQKSHFFREAVYWSIENEILALSE